jgi:hypothetical protein
MRSRLKAARRAPVIRFVICPLTDTVTDRWPFNVDAMNCV